MKRIFLVLIIILINIQNITSQNTKSFTINNLESNQPYPDMGVAFFDDDFVVFSAQIKKPLDLHSRRRRRNTKKNIELLPQNLEFYFTPIDKDGNFINSQKLNNVINSGYDDYGLTFSKDQSIVFFSREMVEKDSEEMHLELFQAKVISPGAWVNIKKLSISHPKYSVGYPCLSEDDKTLYYISNEEGDFNIYKVAIESSGAIGVPIKLSSSINSSSNETTPFVINNKLYFSSDRPGGLGGYDVYFTDLTDEGLKISRIEAPINSPFDDFNYIKKHTNQGFFVSNRTGGKGKEDIYSFKENNNEDTLVLSATKSKINEFFQDEEEKNLANKKTNGSTVDKVIAKNIESKKVKSANPIDKTATINVQGKVKYLKNDTVYDYQRRNSYDIQKENAAVIEELNTSSLSKKDKSKDEYSKCQMEFDKINNIYFDYSESYIREDAAIELDKVIRVLRLCPKIVLQASSHTDSRASNSYNLKLSQARANSVVNYVLRNGHFTPDRIISKGYGEERLTNKCSDGVRCTEKEHQLNRRTHFEIYNY